MNWRGREGVTGVELLLKKNATVCILIKYLSTSCFIATGLFYLENILRARVKSVNWYLSRWSKLQVAVKK